MRDEILASFEEKERMGDYSIMKSKIRLDNDVFLYGVYLKQKVKKPLPKSKGLMLCQKEPVEKFVVPPIYCEIKVVGSYIVGRIKLYGTSEKDDILDFYYYDLCGVKKILDGEINKNVEIINRDPYLYVGRNLNYCRIGRILAYRDKIILDHQGNDTFSCQKETEIKLDPVFKNEKGMNCQSDSILVLQSEFDEIPNYRIIYKENIFDETFNAVSLIAKRYDDEVFHVTQGDAEGIYSIRHRFLIPLCHDLKILSDETCLFKENGKYIICNYNVSNRRQKVEYIIERDGLSFLNSYGNIFLFRNEYYRYYLYHLNTKWEQECLPIQNRILISTDIDSTCYYEIKSNKFVYEMKDDITYEPDYTDKELKDMYRDAFDGNPEYESNLD